MKLYRTIPYWLCFMASIFLMNPTQSTDDPYDYMFVGGTTPSKTKLSNIPVVPAAPPSSGSTTPTTTNLHTQDPLQAGDEPSVLLRLAPEEGMTDTLEQEYGTELIRLAALKNYYNPVVLSLRVNRTTKEIIAGIGGGIASFGAFQVLIPSFLGFLGEVGVSVEDLPTTTALIIAAPLPVVTGFLSAYMGASKLLTVKDQDYLALEKTVTQRQQNRAEAVVYSTPNKVFNTIVWSLMMSAIITELEKGVTGWGPYQVWAVTFSLLYIPLMYYMYVAPTNNPNKHPCRHYSSPEAEKDHTYMLTAMNTVKEEIRDGNLDRMKYLAQQTNTLIADAPATSQTPLLRKADDRASNESVSENSESKSQDSDALITQPDDNESRHSSAQSLASITFEPARSIQDSTHRHAFLRVLDEMFHIYETTPSWKKNWTHGKESVAKYLSYVTQILNLPGRTLGVFGSSYYLAHLVVEPQVSLAIGATATIALFPFIFSGSYKEIPMVMQEFKELFGLYPANSPPYLKNKYVSFLADRLQSLISIGGSSYIVGSMWGFMRHNVFEDILHTQSVPTQCVIIIPFLLPAYAGSRQLSANVLSLISNWVSTGMEVNACCCKFKILPFCNFKAIRHLEQGQHQLDKVEELIEKTINLNDQSVAAIKHVLNQRFSQTSHFGN